MGAEINVTVTDYISVSFHNSLDVPYTLSIITLHTAPLAFVLKQRLAQCRAYSDTLSIKGIPFACIDHMIWCPALRDSAPLK